jgi:branched-chain amino acid aminotransferase
MQKTKYIWQNGNIVKWEDATTHVLSHGLHYGSGVYEGIRVYQGLDNSAIFCLEQHLERLFYSAGALEFVIPFSIYELINAVKSIVELNDLKEGYIRPLVYSGYNQLGVSAKDNPIEVIIACWPWPTYHATNNLDVKLSNYIRIHPKSTKVEAKISGHYVNSLLATLEIKNTHYHEVLLLDNNGYISESSSSNIFLVKDAVLYTPKLGTILPGITREIVINLAKEIGYKVIETDLLVADLLNADEAFFTGTAVEVTSVRSLDDKIIGQDNYYPITQLIKEKYQDIVKSRNKSYQKFLTPVYPLDIVDLTLAKTKFAEQMSNYKQ